MRTFVLALVTIFSLGISSQALAADPAPAAHAAPQAALDALLQQHSPSAQAERDAVLRVLDQAQVKAVAGQMGVDLRQAKNAVRTLDGEQLARVSAQAKAVDQALAGGASTVVISTTTIIIGLLVLILIIIAVK
ncbi:MAG TPA: hypothetical protein VL173_05880 [Vicinamibacterales bacterium]|nr:hypothetical protein [Vicinamibacterales bacterium]